MKLHYLFPVFLILSACSSESATDSTDFKDGQNECIPGAFLRFDSSLAGQGVEYSISVDPDFGAAVTEFDVPFECEVTTGVSDDRSTLCTSVPYEQYGDIRPDEVSPPVLYFDQKKVDAEDSYELTGLHWGYDSKAASVTVKKEGTVVFDGTVTFAKRTCNDGVKDIDYREATIDITSRVGGEGGGGAGGSD